MVYKSKLFSFIGRKYDEKQKTQKYTKRKFEKNDFNSKKRTLSLSIQIELG